MTIPVENPWKSRNVNPAERFLQYAMLVLFLSVAVHFHWHSIGCGSSEIGSDEQPCPVCAVMSGAEPPESGQADIGILLDRGITLPAARPFFTAPPPPAPLPPRGPPGIAG